MKRKGLITVALVAASAVSFAQGYITVGVKQTNGAERVAQLAAPVGKVIGRDAKSGAFHVELRPGFQPAKVAAGWAKLPDVVLARPSLPNLRLDDTDFTSVAATATVLNEMNARNRDIAAIRKARGLPEPEKTDKYKTGYYEGFRYWLEERAFPRDTIDWSAYERAVRQREMMPAYGATDGWNLGNWSYVGPTNLDVPYTTYYGVRPTSGRINAIAVHPGNGNIVYLGTAQGGVWRSTDGGNAWTPLTDNWPFLAVSSLAIDPSNPQVIYAGTGDFPGSRPYTMGVMKSTDGGATWANVGGQPWGSRAINTIVVDPNNTQIVTITTGRGADGTGFIWRSTNGGNTWTSVLNTAANWVDLSIGANNAGTRYYYASGSGGTGTGGQVWRSADRGATWTRLTTPASTTVSHSVIQVAASPIFPDTVYIVVNADRKIFKSTNAGSTWTDVTAGLPATGNSYFWSQSTYNWYLKVSSATTPNPRDILYVGFICVEMSPNGGTSWQTIGGPTYSGTAKTHNDQHSIAIDPANPNRVWIGNDGGLYRYNFDPATNGGTWTYHSRFLGVTQFYKMAVHPTNANYIMGGTQDNATPHSLGDLANWENVGGGDGGFCAINPNNTNIQYATSQSLNIYRTGNAWGSSSGINPPAPASSDPRAFIAPIVIDPVNPNLLYAGTNYLNVRNDATGTWSIRLGNQVLTGGTIRAIAISPSDNRVIYTAGSDGQIWMTTNSGSTWKRIDRTTDSSTTGLPARTFNYLSINPANPFDLLATCSGTGTGHVWRLPNTLATTRNWLNMNGSGAGTLPDIPANAIERDPVDFDNIWWVGTDIGVFVTLDGGLSWLNATQSLGLPNVQVNDFRANPNTNFLTAATFGRGFWRLSLPPIVYPSTISVVKGTFLAGAVADVRTSNDRRYAVICDEDNAEGEIRITGTSPNQTLSELQVVFEGVSTRGDLGAWVEIWDFTTNQWIEVDYRSASTTETRFIATITNNPSRFVAPTTREMRARVRWIPNSDLESGDGWSVSLDRFHWRVTP